MRGVVFVQGGCSAVAVVTRFPDDEDEDMLQAYRMGQTDRQTDPHHRSLSSGLTGGPDGWVCWGWQAAGWMRWAALRPSSATPSRQVSSSSSSTASLDDVTSVLLGLPPWCLLAGPCLLADWSLSVCVCVLW